MNKLGRKSIFISALVALLPSPVFAHTIIGNMTGFGSGFSHPIGGFDHILAMVAVGLWAAQMGGRTIWAVPGTFVTVMLVGGFLGMTGIHIPYVEEGILVSVLVLGVLIAAALRFPVVIGALIVGLFALFHGHAHGSEMSMALGAIPFGLGFASGTLLLHVVGIIAGMSLQRMGSEQGVRLAGGAIVLAGIYLAVP